MGIGETVRYALASSSWALRLKDFRSKDDLYTKLRLLANYQRQTFKNIPLTSEDLNREYGILFDVNLLDQLIEWYTKFASKYNLVGEGYLQSLVSDQPLVFEGAQGVLLDENYGFNPYTTWSTTLPQNALSLVGSRDKVRILGVIRAYHTRHGAGPFPTEDSEFRIEGDHNGYGPWQQNFRIGHLDLVLLRYAQRVASCTELAITCLDHVTTPRVCLTYEGLPDKTNPKLTWDKHILLEIQDPKIADTLANLTPQCTVMQDHEALVKSLQKLLQVPVTILSKGPTHLDKTCL